MRKLVGIFLILIALFMGYVGIAALSGTSDVEGAAAEAVFLGDNHWDPDNEGKLVVAILSPDDLEAAEDPELGILFETPSAARIVDRFEDTGQNRYHWRTVEDHNAEGDPVSRNFMGTVKDPTALGLDPAYGPMLPFGPEVTSLTLKNDKAAALGLNPYPYPSRTYLTNASYSAFEANLDKEDGDLYFVYGDEVGRIRVHYRELWPDDQPLAFIGIQKDHMLHPDPSLDMAPVSSDIESLETMIEENSSTVIAGSVGILIAALAVLLLGLVKLEVIHLPGKAKAAPQAEELSDFLKDS